MSCTRPLKAWQVGKHESGKPKYLITSYNTSPIRYQGHLVVPSSKGTLYRFVGDYIEIPCGKCEACQLSNAKQWTDRCLMELQDHKSSYFITLTYNNENLPTVPIVDKYGEIVQASTLQKRDFQLFMKKLRSEIHRECERYNCEHINESIEEPKIRYFACGEYGTGSHYSEAERRKCTYRAHYHAIMFGLELHDLKPYSRNKLGQQTYTSDWLSKIWNKGYVVIGEVTPESIAYTCRYVLKKAEGFDKKYYENFGMEPEFTLQSRKPGLARNYYERNKLKLFSQSNSYLSTINGSIKLRPNKYFERLFEKNHPGFMQQYKANKKELAESESIMKLSNTSLGYLDYKAVEEQQLRAHLKALERSTI